MIINKPIAFIDIEATGLDTTLDRILSLTIMRHEPSDEPAKPHSPIMETFWCNPEGRNIAPDAQAVHGISDEQAAAFPLTFRDQKDKILAMFEGTIIGGFNIRRFDVPIAVMEFHRCGVHWPPEGFQIIDAEVIYKIKEARDLTAAMRFYLGVERENAHQSEADTIGAASVILEQANRYDFESVDDMAKLSVGDTIDLSGKFIMKDGVPTFNFSKHKGIPVMQEPSMLRWMLDKDFTEETKRWVRKFLSQKQEMQQGETLPF